MSEGTKPVFNDQRTKSKIDLHLRDINDEITEQDIANVKTDVTPTSQDDEIASHEADEILAKNKQEDKDDDTNDEDGNSSNSVETPWNVLS